MRLKLSRLFKAITLLDQLAKEQIRNAPRPMGKEFVAYGKGWAYPKENLLFSLE